MYAEPGTLIDGGLDDDDLLEAFADALESLATMEAHKGLVKEARGYLVLHDDSRNESWDAGELANEIQDALDEYAPPYFYFGGSPDNDGSWGFWFSEDRVHEDLHSGDMAGINDPADLDDVPAYVGAAYHVNDHGNATLYVRSDDDWREVWAIV